MNRNRLQHLFIFGLLLILASGMISSLAFCQEIGELVEKGSWSLRRMAPPESLVTGVSLNELTRARFAGMKKITEGLDGRFGRSYSLFNKEDKNQVRITTAVYTSVAEAENAVLDLLNSVSAVMKSGSKTGSVIGTHSWYLESPTGSGTVIFVYNNSLFQLFSSDYNLAEKSARSIVRDLTEGTHGITLGKKVQIPKITDVVIPEDVQKNKKISINMKAFDPSQRKLTFQVTASKGQLLDTDKTDKKIYIPSESGTDEIKVYTINEANVVSQVFIKKLTVKDEDKK